MRFLEGSGQPPAVGMVPTGLASFEFLPLLRFLYPATVVSYNKKNVKVCDDE
jgi:hypothetical protein